MFAHPSIRVDGPPGKKRNPRRGDRQNLYACPMRVQRARYFLAAVESGSLRAAATRCEVSQPTLREQIILLEEEIDVVLLVRSRVGVRPTPVGQGLIPHFTRLIAAEEAVHRTAAEMGGAFRGRVTIGAISALAETLLAPVASRLLEQHPDLRFEISEANSSDVEAGVLSGDLDIGVVSMPRSPAVQGLSRTRLVGIPLGIVIPCGHPLAQRKAVAWDDVEMWPVVTMRPGTVIGQLVEDRLPHADVVVKAASARTVKVMVGNGAGVGILAAVDTPTDASSLSWVPLLDTQALDICLVHRSDSQPSATALIVRRFIEEQATRVLDSMISPSAP